jgi:hypothetical protein
MGLLEHFHSPDATLERHQGPVRNESPDHDVRADGKKAENDYSSACYDCRDHGDLFAVVVTLSAHGARREPAKILPG